MVRRVFAALAALLLAATLTACTGGDTSSSESVQVVHLVDVDGNELASGAVLGWDDDVFGSPVASDPTFSHAFTVAESATAVTTFLSPRGKEYDTAAWNASGWLGLTPEGILLPNLKLSGNTTAGNGSPAGTAAVATNGGDYSVGIAFLDGTTVIEADFIEIHVAAAADPVDATWTWDAPTG